MESIYRIFLFEYCLEQQLLSQENQTIVFSNTVNSIEYLSSKRLLTVKLLSEGLFQYPSGHYLVEFVHVLRLTALLNNDQDDIEGFRPTQRLE